MPSIEEWNDGELAYCRRLVRNGGDPPRVYPVSIRSYLRTQIAGAERDNRRDVVEVLYKLMEKAPLGV